MVLSSGVLVLGRFLFLFFFIVLGGGSVEGLGMGGFFLSFSMYLGSMGWYGVTLGPIAGLLYLWELLVWDVFPFAFLLDVVV